MFHFWAVIAFLKHHKQVNEILLQYASVGADLDREDSAHILLNPFEV